MDLYIVNIEYHKAVTIFRFIYNVHKASACHCLLLTRGQVGQLFHGFQSL
jgi:hypothetical protein